MCELGKVTMLKHLVKIHHFGQFSGVATYVIRSAMKNIASSTAIIRNFEKKITHNKEYVLTPFHGAESFLRS